jgi:hypothetical protein
MGLTMMRRITTRKITLLNLLTSFRKKRYWIILHCFKRKHYISSIITRWSILMIWQHIFA